MADVFIEVCGWYAVGGVRRAALADAEPSGLAGARFGFPLAYLKRRLRGFLDEESASESSSCFSLSGPFQNLRCLWRPQ